MRKISFKATKRVPKKVNISFETSAGKKITFRATKRKPKPVKISFRRERKRRE